MTEARARSHWLGMKTERLLCLVVTLALAGCLDRELAPIVPCVSQGFVAAVDTQPVDKIDLLFVVDDSPSMVQEQASLAEQIPNLVRVLTTGDRNGDGVREFAPPRSVHAGVVSVNMGVGGYAHVGTCETSPDFGDDGVLIDVPRSGGVGCAASYPRFLAYEPGGGAPSTFVNDVECLARTGTGGCAIEQQLDSPLKALLPSTEDRWTFFRGTHGHGDELNAGFLQEGSLIVVVDITDEDDCSTNETALWDPTSSTYPESLNVRCAVYPTHLYPISRFVDGLRSLRPENPNKVIFATITGVPTDLVALDPMTHQVDYARLFADPRMQVHVHGARGAEYIDPACSVPGRGDAYPGIRMAQVAQAFGANGIVQSICQADFGPALDVVIDTIADQINDVCLPRTLYPDADGNVGCDVVEVVRPTGDGLGPQSCADVPGADPTPASVDPDGAQHCRIAQLPADPTARAAGMPPSGTGWFYDDYTSATVAACTSRGEPQRIAFTTSATPPAGVVVKLECLQRVGGAGVPALPGVAQIGSPCDPAETDATSPHACYAGSGARSMSLFCEPRSLTCQATCATSADCPTALSCDTSQPHPYCVSPICV